jgi:hypothetical protein
MPDNWSHEETDDPLYAHQRRRGAEQLNLLRRAALLLGYMILQQLFNVGAECTSILLS